jgi:hypothetical protein
MVINSVTDITVVHLNIRRASKLGLGGIVPKRKGSPYHSVARPTGSK